MHVELQAVTVVIDFVYPPVAVRRLGSRVAKDGSTNPRMGPAFTLGNRRAACSAGDWSTYCRRDGGTRFTGRRTMQDH